MVQGDGSRKPPVSRRPDHVTVVIDLLGRKFSGGGLDARPLDRKADAVLTGIRDELPVLFEELVRVACPGAGFDRRRFVSVLVLPPVAVGVVAFRLVGRPGRAPEKPLWELEFCQRAPPAKSSGSRAANLQPMCRSIKTLREGVIPATDEEIEAAALQFVRKISGFRQPSKANDEVFREAVAEISVSSKRLLDSLVVRPNAKVAGPQDS